LTDLIHHPPEGPEGLLENESARCLAGSKSRFELFFGQYMFFFDQLIDGSEQHADGIQPP
jgi:hypothetical protein